MQITETEFIFSLLRQRFKDLLLNVYEQFQTLQNVQILCIACTVLCAIMTGVPVIYETIYELLFKPGFQLISVNNNTVYLVFTDVRIAKRSGVIYRYMLSL